MLGTKMLSEGVLLRPVIEDDLPLVARAFDSMLVNMYLNRTAAQNLANEQEWYLRISKNESEMVWAVEYENNLVGITSLGALNFHLSAVSGIVIFNREVWGKGIATRAHLARTYFASEYLNRMTIVSHVRTPNEQSHRALVRVGYSVTGKEYRTQYRGGKYIDTYVYTWINPNYTNILFPEGLPEELKVGVENANIALEKAKKEVIFI